MMRVVAINGSPRRNGNTHQLLEAVLASLAEAGWDTEMVQVGGKSLHGCRACYRCVKNKDGRCSYDDDDFNKVFVKLAEADAMVIGSPTYFADITPETKALIDRAGFVSRANGGLFAGKIGAAVAAVRRGGSLHALDSINHLYLICEMVIPGSTYWNMGYGREAGEVAADTEGMANMAHLGRAIAWLGKAMSAAQAAGAVYPNSKAKPED
jgi:multimeric flavodoxin WrbA